MGTSRRCGGGGMVQPAASRSASKHGWRGSLSAADVAPEFGGPDICPNLTNPPSRPCLSADSCESKWQPRILSLKDKTQFLYFYDFNTTRRLRGRRAAARACLFA